MNLNNILIEDETIKNKYKINYETINDLKALKSKDLENFFNSCVIEYINNDNDFEFENLEEQNDMKKAIIYTFCDSFKSEWDQSKINLDEIKRIIKDNITKIKDATSSPSDASVLTI